MRGFALFVLLSACSGTVATPTPPKAKAPPSGPVDPRTIVLANPTDLPFGVAVDEVNVYYSLIDEGIRRTPKLGGPIDSVVDDDHGPHAIVVDDLWVYAADLGTPPTDFDDGRIVRARKGGGPLQILASDLGAPFSLVLQGNDVVFAASGTRSFGAYNNDGAIYRVPRDGSAPAMRLAKNQRHPVCVVTDDAYVYWVNDFGGTIVRCALAGCDETPEVLYADQDVPRSLAIAGTWLYWSNWQTSNIVRASKNGGGTIEEVAASLGYPTSLLLDHDVLYWVESLSHKIQSLPNGAPRPRTLAEEPFVKDPQRVVVDETSVFYTDQGASNVVRLPR